ncbi:MAG: DNA primase [Acidimicrobiia bacterium]|nr:DNA primase [Acidimicrobiia bacterium]MXX45690.1 DNA primase [Acidimicrobiia bacterium]
MVRGDDDRERVRAAVNLVEQFAAITKVKRSGRSFTALCPFHQEKTPSLSIDPARGLFYCFGCHKGGDVFTLVQETQGLSFPDALQALARQAGIVLTQRPGDGKRAADRERLVAVMRRAVDFYTRRLLSGADAGPARAYLRSRGYDRALIEKFGLGFSPTEEPSLGTELRSAGVSNSVMERAGLAVRRGWDRGPSDDGFRDRFRGRIMFPIHDLRGDPVGFGARLMGGDGPKYLNSPETPLYRKSRLLYGLHLARREISRSDRAVVVEGYTDVIAMHRAGMESAVATCGTALGEEHLEALGRLGQRIVLAFDADRAGSDAVLRGERVSRRSGRRLDLRVAELPDGKDPADLLQEDRLEEVRQAVDDSRPALQYRMERRLAGVDLTDPESRARAVNELGPLLAAVADQATRAEYERTLSRMTGAGLSEIQAVVRRGARGAGIEGRAGRRRPDDSGGPASRVIDRHAHRGSAVERELLKAVLANHPALRELEVDSTLFGQDLYRQAFQQVEADWRVTPIGRPTPIAWRGECSPDESERQGAPDEVDRELLAISADGLEPGDPRPLVIRCRRAALRREMDAIGARMRSLAADDPQRTRLLAQVVELERRRQELTGDLR